MGLRPYGEEGEWVLYRDLEHEQVAQTSGCCLDFSKKMEPLTSTLQCNSALRAEGTGRLAWAALRNMKNLPYFMGKQSKHRLICTPLTWHGTFAALAFDGCD